MDIKQLRYFICIVECGSISKAAEQLHIAQPSLSQHVLNLEAELGVQLLNRSSRGITATRPGIRLVEHARELLSRIEQIKRDIKETAEGLMGDVILGMPEQFSAILTVPIIERAEKLFPNINLHIIGSMSGNLAERLLAGGVDIAILFQVQVRNNPDLVIEPLVSEDLYFVGSNDSSLSATEEISFHQLIDLPLILPAKKHGLRILMEKIASAENMKLNVQSEVDSTPAIKSLLRLKGKYTLFSEVVCMPECKSGDFFATRIVDPAITQTSVLAYRNREEMPEPLTLIHALIIDVVRDLVSSNRWPGATLEQFQHGQNGKGIPGSP